MLRRRDFSLLLATLAGGGLMASSGCSLFSRRSEEDLAAAAHREKLLTVPAMPDWVKQAAVPHGLNFVSVESVAAINQLPGTGGSIPPSPMRDELVEEMKRRDVSDPQLFLERPETALVRVQAIIPPGARRGDPLDIRILSPPQTNATNLHSGWLLESRLRQRQMLSGAVRKSEVMVIGTGRVLTRANVENGEDENLRLEGYVLGGGRIQQDRRLGLVIRPEFQHAKLAAKLAHEINQRFYYYSGTSKGGIARAVEDDFIEIQVHQRYRRNIHRLMAVVGNVYVRGEGGDVQARLADLGRQLNDPVTAANAALQLEAFGQTGVPTLLEGQKHSSAEIQFYSSEALAYLDRGEAVDPLEKLAAEEPAFRYPALLALETMEGRASLDALQSLLHHNSIETRYGALRAIRRRSDGQVMLRPVKFGSDVDFYHIPSQADGFIAVSTAERPEIVCYGQDPAVRISDFLMGPGGLMVQPDKEDPSKLAVSCFRPGAADRRTSCSADVSGLLQAIIQVGGNYGACVEILRAAKDRSFIDCGLAISPLPEAMREYHRPDGEELSDPGALPPSDYTAAMPEEPSPWWAWWR